MPKKARSRPVKKPNDFVIFIERHIGRNQGVYGRDIANQIGITPGAFSIRMQNGKFDYLEMVKIFKYLGATDEEILNLMK